MGKRKFENKAKPLIAPSAVVSPRARLGPGVVVWNFVQVREDAMIGGGSILGNGVYVDKSVRIGKRVVIQNKASVYRGVEIEDEVFIGPHVCFTNDLWPDARTIRRIHGVLARIGKGAVIGANVTILPDVSVGAYALVGAGSVVTQSVPSHALVVGNPARVKRFICRCKKTLHFQAETARAVKLRCRNCRLIVRVAREHYDRFLRER
jgi:acetyltransferase-like isoleucine patch superfamily enzyme